jgi:hypothetical protein
VLLRLADLNNNLAEKNKTPGGMGGYANSSSDQMADHHHNGVIEDL